MAMRFLAIPSFVLLLAAVHALELEVVDIPAGILNKDVKRNIDLRTHMEEVSLDIIIENGGSNPATDYIFAIPPEKVSHLSFLFASHDNRELKSQRVHANDALAPKGSAFFRIQFASPLGPGATTTLRILQVYIHTLIPFPAEILQQQSQLVEYHDNHFYFSPYPTQSIFTTIRLASERVENRSATEKPSKQRKDTLEYGPYETKKPYAVSPLYAHFENNHPFVTFTKMVKEIEISHWGNVVVEEHYQLKHTGAALKGSFSRFEYQRAPQLWGRSSFRTITAVLPKYAHAVYYRDIIGNISTSHLREERHQKVLEVDPRFPMFGGWKTDFQIGYGLPAVKVLSVDSSNPTTHVLNISFASPFSSAVVDKSTLRIILPEGASDVKYIVPFPMDDEGFDQRFTSLVPNVRPVLVLRKKNLCRLHNQYIQVIYTFSRSAMIKEPLILSGMFLFIFAAIMFCTRIDLSLSTQKKRLDGDKSASLNESSAAPGTSSKGALYDLRTDALSLLMKLKTAYVEKDLEAATKAFAQLTEAVMALKKLDPKHHETISKVHNLLGAVNKAGKAFASAPSSAETSTKEKFLLKISDVEQLLSTIRE